MRMTVFGASGGIGGHIVRQALAAGHEVTAVVRDSARFDVRHPALELAVVPGLTDPAVLLPAVKGRTAVLSGVGPRTRSAGPVASTATRAILAALATAGVRRFVAVSAVPVGPVPPDDSQLNRRVLMPLISRLLRDLYADLAAMEADIAASGTDWTVVRPPKLTDGSLTRAYRTRIGGNVPRGYRVSRADVAHLMLAAVDDPATVGEFLGIAN